MGEGPGPLYAQFVTHFNRLRDGRVGGGGLQNGVGDGGGRHYQKPTEEDVDDDDDDERGLAGGPS